MNLYFIEATLEGLQERCEDALPLICDNCLEAWEEFNAIQRDLKLLMENVIELKNDLEKILS